MLFSCSRQHVDGSRIYNFWLFGCKPKKGSWNLKADTAGLQLQDIIFYVHNTGKPIMITFFMFIKELCCLNSSCVSP